MEIWFLALAIIVVGAGLLSWSSLYVHIQYNRTVEIDELHLRVRLFDLFQVYHLEQTNCVENFIQKQVSEYLREKDAQKAPQTALENEKKARRAPRDINYAKILMKRFICERLYCRVRVHSMDASTTAVLYGAVQFTLHFLLAGLKRQMHFTQNPQLIVLPEFQTGGNSLEFQCILKTKLGNIISILKKFK